MKKRPVPDRVKKVQALRQSGAPGKWQDKRGKRARTRQARKARALREENF